LGYDLQLLVFHWLSGRDLCSVARACKDLTSVAHDDVLWRPKADGLPEKWAYDRAERHGEPAWAYTLRVRRGLYGAWAKLNEHRAGNFPYLSELGVVDGVSFVPKGNALPYKLTYGAVCEMVQLCAKAEGSLNALVYKRVAALLVSFSPNSRTPVPSDLHMTVREIYKTCYPGFGAGTGSGAYAPGLQAGGSSTKGGTSGVFLGKGVATMTKKVQDEEMRKRLDTTHEFLALIAH